MDQCTNNYKKMLQLLSHTVLTRENSVSSKSWMYEDGVTLKGLELVWKATNDEKYIQFIQQYVDRFVTPDGRIPFVEPRPLSLDNINNGKIVFTMYHLTKSDRYERVLQYLCNQLALHPRNADGGFWHKVRYPGQMWLDGLFMAQPFAAEYAKTFHHPEAFDTIALQFKLIHEHAYNPDKCLYYHAFDYTKEAFWCDKTTGCSKNFWGRALGWLSMAAVDCLDFFPEEHAGRQYLLTVLQSLAKGLKRYQHPELHVWYQIVDMADEKGNYPEMSCSCMFAYSLYKASQKGYIDASYKELALQALNSIWTNYVTITKDGLVSLHNICKVAGLGPAKCPERDGTFSYYIHEPVVSDDNKGVGPLLCLLALVAEDR